MRLPTRGRKPRLGLTFLCLLAAFLPSAVLAGPKPARVSRKPIRGRLVFRKVDGARTPFLEIGPRSVRLLGDGRALARLGKLNRKYLDVRGRAEGAGDGLTVSIDDPRQVSVQKPLTLRGIVRKVETDEGDPLHVLATESGDLRIGSGSLRKFEGFLGRNVEAVGHLGSDGETTWLEQVRRVERKLLPGEREPGTGPAALAGTWKGAFVATEVPKGVPLEPGDYGIRISSGPDLSKVGGRLMRTYDIVGVKIRRWTPGKRSIEFDIDYDFGRGSSSVRCTGTFGADWKVLSGEWKSGSLGKGTFRVTWEPPKE